MAELASILTYQIHYTLSKGLFAMSGGKSSAGQDSVLVRLETTDGVVGWGEVAPFSPRYIPGFAGGALAAISEFGPSLLGVDPRSVDTVQTIMNRSLKGHYYAKSAVDMACWDILGKYTGLSVAALLGGRLRDTIPLYQGIRLGEPLAMRDEAEGLLAAGYRSVQIKVGDDIDEDLRRIRACLEVLAEADHVIVDANAGWNVIEARSVIDALRVENVTFEQPCASIEACKSARQGSGRPLILDESLDGFEAVDRARTVGALDGANLKLTRLGGITPTRRISDFCVQSGIPVSIEDSGGGDVVSAAVAHLMANTDPSRSLHSYMPNTAIREKIASGAPSVTAGSASVPLGPGLGIDVDESALGERVIEIQL